MNLRKIMSILESNSVYTDRTKIWYHASDEEFDEFDLSHSRFVGFWFTDNPDLLGYYGHVHYKANLSINNPKIISKVPPNSWGRAAAEAYSEGYDSIVFENVIDGDCEATNICIFDEGEIHVIDRTNTCIDEAEEFERYYHFNKKENREKIRQMKELDHPNANLLLGMRKAFLKDGMLPAEIMSYWLKGTQPDGMKKIPVPKVPLEYRSLFERLVTEKKYAGADFKLKNAMMVAMNILAIQMIDPNWYSKKLVDLKWPNLIDKDFIANTPNGYFYAALFDARAQDSYRIVYGED